MGGGLRGFSRRGRRSYKGDGPAFCRSPALGAIIAFVGAPPSGRWVVVCEAFRGEGAAPTKKLPHHLRPRRGVGQFAFDADLTLPSS